jgi:hypothetical protein
MNKLAKIVGFSLLVCMATTSHIADAAEGTVDRTNVTQCSDEGKEVRAERASNGWMQSSPLWVDGQLVKCVNGKAVVNGRVLTDEELNILKEQALSGDFDK